LDDNYKRIKGLRDYI